MKRASKTNFGKEPRQTRRQKSRKSVTLLARCRENGVIPELSFVLGGPEDPEGEVERTLVFVRKVKTLHPEAEVILYFYTPTPQKEPGAGDALPVQRASGPGGPPLAAPGWSFWETGRFASPVFEGFFGMTGSVKQSAGNPSAPFPSPSLRPFLHSPGRQNCPRRSG